MSFTINQLGLKDTLDKVAGVIPAKSPIPALDCVRLKIEDGKARITATDLNTWLLAMVGCNSNGTKAELLIPGKKLQEVVSLLPSEEISFELGDDKIGLHCKNVKHNISTIPAENYPAEQCLYKKNGKESYLSLPRDGLQAGLEAISFASSKEEGPIISGISFNIGKDKLKLATTDGHRLASYSIPIESKIEKKLVVPASVTRHISKMDGDEIRMYFDDNLAGFYSSNLGLTSRLLEGEFPPYEKIIPTDNDKKLIANRKELINAIRQIQVFAKDNHEIVEVNASEKDGFTLSAKGEGFDSQAKVDCQYKGSDIRTGISAKYLLQNLQSTLAEEIEWSFKTPLSAMMLKTVPCENKDNFYLIMPVQLQ